MPLGAIAVSCPPDTIRELMKDPLLIALLGVTGAGKTTFVSLASGRTDLKIGHGVDPCTQDPQVVDLILDDRRVQLIDTPGFDDDTRSDVDILGDIAKWLAKRGYLQDRLFDGLIFLHPITLNRVGGSERSRTQLLEKILGKHAYNRVVIATTMWDDLKSGVTMEERLSGRLGAGGVWHDMCKEGARLVKHHNTSQSAHDIIRGVIETSEKLGRAEPQLQIDIRKTRGHVVKTGAGKELERQLKKDIKLLKKDLEAHLNDRPPEMSKKDRNSENRREWREWVKIRKEIETRLQLREQQLKRLRSLTFRFTSFLKAIFGG